MINGAHILFYSAQPAADRAFFRDKIGLKSIDIGGGWLIFALPPSEAAVHPGDENAERLHADRPLLGAVVYLMCDDLHVEVKALAAKGVRCTDIGEESWGIKTTIPLPSGGEIGLYQPKHPTALALG